MLLLNRTYTRRVQYSVDEYVGVRLHVRPVVVSLHAGAYHFSDLHYLLGFPYFNDSMFKQCGVEKPVVSNYSDLVRHLTYTLLYLHYSLLYCSRSNGVDGICLQCSSRSLTSAQHCKSRGNTAYVYILLRVQVQQQTLMMLWTN